MVYYRFFCVEGTENACLFLLLMQASIVGALSPPFNAGLFVPAHWSILFFPFFLRFCSFSDFSYTF